MVFELLNMHFYDCICVYVLLPALQSKALAGASVVFTPPSILKQEVVSPEHSQISAPNMDAAKVCTCIYVFNSIRAVTYVL